MQGFNMGRYRPPDEDPSRESWNKSHPLGKRAHKIDQGILVVRFELPFGIWCGSCDTHIGQGVRFNAEKRTVGKYLSTPIFAFRCKCATCKNHFEIQTDPKNTRYVVTEGARQKEEEWDPEQNGGFAVFDTEASTSAQPLDAFSQLEKTTAQATRARTAHERILELEAHASSRSADPYALNVRLRTSARAERKEEQRTLRDEAALRGRIGWDEDRVLVREGEVEREEARAAWVLARDEAARERVAAGQITPRTREAAQRLRITGADGDMPSRSASSGSIRQHKPSSSTSLKNKTPSLLSQRHRTASSMSLKSPTAKALAARVLANTRRKTDPFGQ